MPGQQPGAVAQVLDQVLDMAEGEEVMALLLNAREIAELPARRGQGLVVAEAGPSMLGGQLLDVKLQLLSKPLPMPTVEQHSEAEAQPGQESQHVSPPRARRPPRARWRASARSPVPVAAVRRE